MSSFSKGNGLLEGYSKLRFLTYILGVNIFLYSGNFSYFLVVMILLAKESEMGGGGNYSSSN